MGDLINWQDTITKSDCAETVAKVCKDTIERLTRRIAELEMDAERYRFVRRMVDPKVLALLNEVNLEPESEEEFDAAIDAAIAKEKANA